MPTGYTHPLIEKNLSTRDFAKLCLRAMGVCAHMRDEDFDVPAPSKVVPDTSYHEEHLAQYTEQLKTWNKMTKAQKAALVEFKREQSLTHYALELQKEAEANATINRALEDLKAWSVCADLAPYKEFMMSQLNMSLENGTYYEDSINKLMEKTTAELVQAYAQDLTWNINYHTEGIQKEIHAAAEKNKYLALAWEAIDRLPSTPELETAKG